MGGRILGPPPLVFAIAAGMVALLLAVAAGYGFHRDELYFILAGRHPDFGYVDQPPLTPLLSAAAVQLLGLTPTAVRVVPALAAGAAVVLVADMARRMGATHAGQILAAFVLAISGWLAAGHLDVTTTYDVLFWTIALWLLIPLLAQPTDQPPERRRWVALGLVVGVALENKTLVILLPLTLGVSLLLLRRWDVLRSPWPWVAAAIGGLLLLPNVIWQATHGFPQLQMAQQITADQGGLGGRIEALVQLLALAGPLLFPVALAGVVWLLRSPASRPWRPLGLMVVLLVAVMLVVGGKSYYSAGVLPLAIAAGATPLAGWLGRGRVVLRRGLFALAAVLSGAIVAVVLLPLVPVTALHSTPIPAIYGESVAQVGWPELAAQVATVADTLSATERQTAVILTETYGEYSALVLLRSGLPPIYSGHNSTWDWGRPPDGARPIIVVAFDPRQVAAAFTGCRVAATIDNGYDLPTQEQGMQILICAAPSRPWSTLWPSLRHVD